jgi:hypothetical protein
MMPHDVHAIRGPKAGTGTASKAVEADLGPVRYFATLIGSTDEQTLRWFILAARVAAGSEPQRHHRAPLRHRLVGGDIWCNPDYSTGSYSPSYSTGGYYNPCYSVSYSSLRRRP